MTVSIKIIKKSNLKEKPNQEQVWNLIAKAWNKYVVKKIPIVEEFLTGKKGKIIDLGCGDGRNMISSPVIEYYGVDFSSAILKHAENRIKKEKIKAKLFKSKINNLPIEFKDNMFDYGLFIASLHCLETPKQRKIALTEFNRVLKPGAEALISVWNSEDKRFKHIGNKGDIYMSWKEQRVSYMRYYYLYTKREFLNSLKKAGFEILHFYSPREHNRFSKKNWIVRVKKQFLYRLSSPKLKSV